MLNHYHIVKAFVKSIASSYVHGGDSHAAVLSFSDTATHHIKLNEYTDFTVFSASVDAMPLMGSATRVDRALRLAQEELLIDNNGARSGHPKILVLITDEVQTQHSDNIVNIADKLRENDVRVIVVAVGEAVNSVELVGIAGGRDKAFSFTTFTGLLEDNVLESIQTRICLGM